MTTNERRMESLRQLTREYRPQCIAELIWQACITHDVESYYAGSHGAANKACAECHSQVTGTQTSACSIHISNGRLLGAKRLARSDTTFQRFFDRFPR